MKFCNYCGNPNADPARFCSKCGAQLPNEFVRESSQTISGQTAFAGAGPSFAAQPSASQTNPKLGPPKVLFVILGVAAVLLVMFIFGNLVRASRGITGTWKASLDWDELNTLLDQDYGYSFTFGNPGQMDIVYELNEDNSMTMNISAKKSLVNMELTVTGTYEVLSADTIRMHESNVKILGDLLGFSQTWKDEIDNTYEMNYVLNGNSLTFISDNKELKMKRS